MKQSARTQAQNLIQLLSRSLAESGSAFARNTSPELCTFFSPFRSSSQSKYVQAQYLQPKYPQASQSQLKPLHPKQLPQQQAPLLQKKPEFQKAPLSKLPTPAQLKPKLAAPIKEPLPQPILPQESHAPALLELERSHLIKLLPKKVRIEQVPSLDLKTAGIRFTERKTPLPSLQHAQPQWLFGISSSLRQSDQLKNFVETIQKAVHEQLQQPSILCSFMQPLGVAEIASISLTQAPIFLFITDTEHDLALKILKKVPGFKDDEKTLIHESPLHIFTINLHSLNDTQFKRALWSTLKNYAGR